MMKILCVTSHYNPFKPSGGAEQRYNLLLHALACIGHVDVVTFRPGIKSDIENCDVVFSETIPAFRPEGRRARFRRLLRPMSPYSYFPVSPQRAKIVEKIIKEGNYDLIVSRYILETYECDLMRYADKLIIDVDDMPVDEWMSMSRNAKSERASLYYKICASFIERLLPGMLAQVRHTFFPNKEQVMGAHSSYLPNIPFYEMPELSRKSIEKKRLLFVGDLRYAPNYLGVEHFVEKVLPIIQNTIPDVQFYLAGKHKGAEWANQMEQHKGVHVLGFVEDLEAEYAKANVCVVSVYSGAGTNIKVLEALQADRACVVAEEATRGFASIFRDEEDYCVAHTDEEFAKYVCELLRDDKRNNAIAEHGAKTVREHFSRKAFYDIVRDSLLKIKK